MYLLQFLRSFILWGLLLIANGKEEDSFSETLSGLKTRIPHSETLQLLKSSYEKYSARKEVLRNVVRKQLPHLQKTKVITTAPTCAMVPIEKRLGCLPLKSATKQECLDVNCCWDEIYHVNSNIPTCYFSKTTVRYKIMDIQHTEAGINALLQQVSPSGFPKDIPKLNVSVSFCDEKRLRLKISDSTSRRFEVPGTFLTTNCSSEVPAIPLYDVDLFRNGTFSVRRWETQSVIFSIDFSSLVYSDQFLQISSFLPSHFIYGLGDHLTPLLKDTNWTKYTFFNRDQIPKENMNLYSSFPFYIVMEEGASSHGIYLFNSNAMDITLQPSPSITFRTIGGILDFFIMLGPTPNEVIQQFSELVGHPAMPPYWSLGFHLSRLGYFTLNKTAEVWKRTVDAGIPFDTQWNDIDYMNGYNDFTYDTQKFHGLPEFVNSLHQLGMHYVLILDPGISSAEPRGSYPPYDDGVAMDIFIKNISGQPLQTKVWNKISSVFPDFTNPATKKYWKKQLAGFEDVIAFDGIWLDMNEPTNFLNGSFEGCPADSRLEHPIYVPGDDPLFTKTICMTANHYISAHYNLHNIYGTYETEATYSALADIRRKRPFVLTRAGFPSISRFGAMWNGDMISMWEHMRASIPSILGFNMAGIPMAGADICGFNNDTSVELCARWFTLGAFYPFCRNHNSDENIEQDPVALGPVVVESAKMALTIRYFLLPYLYTLFFLSHTRGDAVARPLFFEFPRDLNTYRIDQQFMWGSSLMINPALEQGASQTKAYFPVGLWYDFTTGHRFKSVGQYFVLPSPLTKVNLAVRSGSIIPAQGVSNTTTECRKNYFELLVALDAKGNARGSLYWDDGDSLGTIEAKKYNLIEFSASQNLLSSSIVVSGYKSEMTLGTIVMFGVVRKPTQVTVNGQIMDFIYSPSVGVLQIRDLSVSLLTILVVSW